MRGFLRDNGLSIVLFALFALSLAGQAAAGWRAYEEELRTHAVTVIGFLAYLSTGHFLSAVFENCESEFLQMAAYVLLTVFLVQKGSSESKKPGEPNPEDEPPHSPPSGAPTGPALRWHAKPGERLYAIVGLWVRRKICPGTPPSGSTARAL